MPTPASLIASRTTTLFFAEAFIAASALVNACYAKLHSCDGRDSLMSQVTVQWNLVLDGGVCFTS